MSTTRLLVCVLVSAPAIGIALLDPMFGAGVFAGAAGALVAYAVIGRRSDELRTRAVAAAAETSEDMLSTMEFELPPIEPARGCHVRLETVRYM